MSNKPLPDIVCRWADGTKLNYSLFSGKTSIYCPHVCTDTLFRGESIDKWNDKKIKDKNNYNNRNNNNNNNNNSDKNNNGKKKDKKNEKGFYWEGNLINQKSIFFSPFSSSSSPNPPSSSSSSSSSSIQSPSSTTYCQSLDFVDLNPLPIYLKVYIVIAQKAIKKILKEENNLNFHTLKLNKIKKYNVINYNNNIENNNKKGDNNNDNNNKYNNDNNNDNNNIIDYEKNILPPTNIKFFDFNSKIVSNEPIDRNTNLTNLNKSNKSFSSKKNSKFTSSSPRILVDYL